MITDVYMCIINKVNISISSDQFVHISRPAWLISRTFSANEQYFSLTTNQPTILSTMAYQQGHQFSWQLLLQQSSGLAVKPLAA